MASCGSCELRKVHFLESEETDLLSTKHALALAWRHGAGGGARVRGRACRDAVHGALRPKSGDASLGGGVGGAAGVADGGRREIGDHLKRNASFGFGQERA